MLRRCLVEARLERISESDFERLREKLAPISEGYLRELVRDCDLELDPVVEGVRQNSFAELGRTLRALAAEYETATLAGDRERAGRCRQAVLTSKQHARLSASRAGASDEDRRRKQEMAAWMLVWLENPGIFPAWLHLRERSMQ
jgi:hypothetical protein